jgi:hypothetical protein
LISHNIDLEGLDLPKLIDKTFKIYIGRFYNHINDFLILGTNKGVVFLRFNFLLKPEILPSFKLNEMNDAKLFFYSISDQGTSLQEFIYSNISVEGKSVYQPKKTIINNTIFDTKAIVLNYYHRFKIDFSFEGNYMSAVDITNSSFTIFQLSLTDDLRYSAKPIKHGKCAELEWCGYDNIFAITGPNADGLIQKVDSKKKNIKPTVDFSLIVFRINEETVQTIYIINEYDIIFLY